MAREKLQVVLELVANQFKNETRGLSRVFGGFRQDLDQSGKSTSMLEQGLGRVGRTAGLALGGAAVGAAAAMTRELAMSIKAFADFEQKMTQSLAIMGDVSSAMKGEMSDAAREVGRTTLFSASQAAEAYFFLASAGLDAKASVEAMPQVAKFAQAGMFDLATATDLATDAQSALGLKSNDARHNLENLTRVTDVFVRANTLANTSVQQISEAMTNKAGAALRALGKDIEEGSAVLAAFADQGVKGAEAGTQFSIVLRDLQTKALENQGAFLRYGVAVFDAAGEMRNMADIIGDLEVALEGMSDAEQKSTLLGLGFSDKSVSAITTLLGTSDAIRQYEMSLRSAAGFTEQVADKQLDSLSGQFELLKSSIDDTRIAVGEQMAPAFRDLLPDLQQAVDAFGEFAIAAAPTAAGALSALITLLEGAQEGFFDLKGAILGIPGSLTIPGTNINFGELFGTNEQAELARQQAALMEVLGRIRRQGLTDEDRDAPTEFANALVHLERQALLTEESMESLARTFGLSTDETLMGLRAYQEWMRVHKEDIPTDQLERWILELEAVNMEAQELERFRSMFPEVFGAAGDAASDNSEAVGQFGEEVRITADEAERLADALMIAAENQESLADQLLRFANPVYNAVAAIEGLRTAEEKLEEVRADREATSRDIAEAELDVTAKTLEAQAALDALGDTTDGIDALAVAFDGPRERLIEILETLGVISGSSWSTILDIEARLVGIERAKRILESEGFKYGEGDESTRPPSKAPTAEEALAGIEGAQHQGGWVEAGSRQHVLNNEVFVPAQSGYVFPVQQPVQEGDQNIQITVPDAATAYQAHALFSANRHLTRGGLKGGAR